MADKAWKQFERHAASLFDGKRHWANSGERVDFESDYAIGQCKLVKSLSLEALTKLAEEMQVDAKSKDKIGVVCVKVRRGSGKSSPTLVVMTEESFKVMAGYLAYWGAKGHAQTRKSDRSGDEPATRSHESAC